MMETSSSASSDEHIFPFEQHEAAHPVHPAQVTEQRSILENESDETLLSDSRFIEKSSERPTHAGASAGLEEQEPCLHDSSSEISLIHLPRDLLGPLPVEQRDLPSSSFVHPSTMASAADMPSLEQLSIDDKDATDGSPEDFIASIMVHGHEDLISVIKENQDGTRLMTASSDHRIKVWHRDDVEKEDWQLSDTWKAHNAEVRDADWNGMFTGTHICSVGEDMKFKIWEEDTSQAYNSGRRFKCIYSITSQHRQPWVSCCFKQIDLDSWVVIITRDGLLTLMEPTAPQTFTDWTVLDQFQVCPKPPRGEETSFKVVFLRDKLDITHTLHEDSNRKSLSLAVAAMDTVKLFRTDDNHRFYLAQEIRGHGGLVRSVDWAPGSVRGYDLIASGCKDGKIRIFEVYTTLASPKESSASPVPNTNTSTPRPAAGARSGIGEVFGGASSTDVADRDARGEGVLKHTTKMVACIESHEDVWDVKWDPFGGCLATNGDDGITRLWKRGIDGEWYLFAEVDQENMDVP